MPAVGGLGGAAGAGAAAGWVVQPPSTIAQHSMANDGA